MTSLPPAVQSAIDASARPQAVRAALERLIDARPALAEELAVGGDTGLLRALVTVLAASPALGRLLQSDPASLEVLRDLATPLPLPATGGAEGAGELVAWSRREQLRVAGRDLTGLDDLESVGRNLALLADAVLAGARSQAGPAAEGLAVIAMGKAGACELNYASDVDILLVGEGEPRQLLETARRCFRLDLDLRPEGRSGPLVRSLESFLAYWQRWAQAWERQALLKARPVAGPAELCAEFATEAGRFVWEEPFSADDLRELRHMKARAEQEVVRRRLAGREIKRGPGGIRDVEFSVQLLQLIHGHLDVGLRVPATLPALRELAGAGYVDGDDAVALEGAYRFLRTVEHRLQLAEGQQTHTVPADGQSLQWLARVLGLPDDASSAAADKFLAELRTHQAIARAVHQRLFFRPLLEAFSAGGGPQLLGPALSEAAAGERLAAFGFADGQRARAALVELTRGLTRSSRMMQSLLPLMLGWLADTPDPDLGLSGLRHLAGIPATRRDSMIGTFRDSPDVAARVCRLLGTSPLLHGPLRRDPALLGRLASSAGLAARGRADLLDQARQTVGWRSEATQRQSGLRRFKAGEEAAVMAADILDEAVGGAPTAGAGWVSSPSPSVDTVGRWLADLAEAVLEAALAAVEPRVPIALIGMGRLGGAELSYASDLDVLVVLGSAGDGRRGSGGGPVSAFEAELGEADASRLLRFVNGDTPARRIYELDLRLRPEGRRGALARSIEGYAEYYRRWAGVWERQALLRARPLAGDAGLARRFMTLADEITVGTALSAEEAREIRRMKARIETERLPPGEDPEFHLKLGPGSISDVEWTVQLLQLMHGVGGTATLGALDSLVATGALAAEDALQLADSYRYCELLRNRLYLVRGTPGDALPSAPDGLSVLARSLETSPAGLRDRYRQVTRRARRVTERLFYAREPQPPIGRPARG